MQVQIIFLNSISSGLVVKKNSSGSIKSKILKKILIKFYKIISLILLRDFDIVLESLDLKSLVCISISLCIETVSS